MVHLLLRTPPFFALMSVYYILRFSVTFYTTLTARTKKNFYCSQKLVKRFRNGELGFINETPRIVGLWIKSYQKLDLKQTNLTQQHPFPVISKQSSITSRYNESLCSELLQRSKLTTKFKDGVKLIKFNTKDLERLCKQFDQDKNWVSDLSKYPSIKQLRHTFQSLMNTCSLVDNSSLNHKLEQGYAFKSVCDFISSFIDQTHLQLEELTDAGISRYQVNCLASKVSAGLDFIEELLKLPMVQDIHLHRICVDHIDILIDQCFALGERINERQ